MDRDPFHLMFIIALDQDNTIMKKVFTSLFTAMGNTIIFAQIVNSNFGINTTTPEATLDIVSLNNTELTKSFRISNGDLMEIFTVNDGTFVGINTPSPTAQFEITSTSSNKSVLKLTPVSATDLRQSSNINYNKFSSVMTDANGNIFKQKDIKDANLNAITFDGRYITSGAVNKILCSINKGSILRFTISTGFLQGASGVGVAKYVQVSWSGGGGFRIISTGHEFGNNNPNSYSVTGAGTNILRCNIQNGDDLIFEITGGNLVYRQVNSSTGIGRSEPFAIIKSLRTR